ncbi:hypothetical protein RM572_05155 [Streptomyces sp. DSM 42041]|uniref:Uncharacterized protein n=1 Tax=Streptomyces hazeniae TaxID=3075538 RepID=A0ABU2NMG4_9ACTN|nr:hypothetical protein [Streptomyces sp. DSM 42041]MDT0378164.1 hypothetical protein [Streptomyces sp. DSM 42041]
MDAGRSAVRVRVVVRAVCVLVLVVLHVVGGYFVLLAWATTSEGPWDRSVTGMVRGAALAGLAAEALAVVLTAALVATVRLRRWWYLIPALLAPAAVVRMLFAPVP